MCGTITAVREPERILAEMFKADLNVDIDPQALRMFVRSRWVRLCAVAHSIHEGESLVKVGRPNKYERAFKQAFGE